MKRKSILMSLSFSGYILLAIVLQAAHSWEHLYAVFQEKHCEHHYAKGLDQINHAHTPLDHCFACDFAFTGVSESPVYSFKIVHFQDYSYSSFFYKQQTNSIFSGCLFADRAPPRLLFI
ncbi:MAG: hypothetical protein RLZZ231_1493 [Bacteroidota bacterium]